MRFVLVVIAIAATACVPTPTKRAATRTDLCASRRTDLDAIAASFDGAVARDKIPIAALAVVAGDCVFTKATNATVHTRFQLASMTKTFTALTAYSLERSNSFSRANRLPFTTTSTATIEQLLAHRAGFPVDMPDDSSLDLATFFDDNKTAPMWADPNEVFLYSNIGFAAAGLAMQDATNTPFAQLVEDRVFAPANMSDARMTVDDTDGFAIGASGDPTASTKVLPTDEYITSTFYGPMGGAWASADDLAHFMSALLGDDEKLITHEQLADMTTSRGETDEGPGVGYGQGIFVTSDGTWFHDGSVAGFGSEMDLSPKAHFGVAVLAACDWALPTDALETAFERFGPAPSNPPPDDGVPDAQVVGRYVDDDGLGDVIIASSPTGLTATFPKENITEPLVENAPGSFTMTWPPWSGDVEVTIERSGSAQYFVAQCGIAKLVPNG